MPTKKDNAPALASSIIKDGKKLTAEIKDIGGLYRKLDERLHIAACSAVYLASKDGRCNWLNELFSELTQSHRDYLRGWLSQSAKFDDKSLWDCGKWLKFERDATNNWFQIVPDTQKLRPQWTTDDSGKAEFLEHGIIDAVASDFNRSFVHKTVQETSNDVVSLDDQLANKFKGIESFVKKAMKENPSLPASILEAVQGAKIAAQASMFEYLHPKLAAAKEITKAA